MTGVSPGFGSRLRAERDRAGLELSAVAASTKIARPLLEALERDDLSRWPAGLYGRSFLRAYVTAIGLAPEPWLAAYAQLVRDDGRSATGDLPAHAADESGPTPSTADAPLTLLLADPAPPASPVYARCLSAAVEWGVVVCAGAIASWVLGTSLPATAGMAALVYYPVAAAMPPRSRLPWKARAGRLGMLSSVRRSDARPGFALLFRPAGGTAAGAARRSA